MKINDWQHFEEIVKDFYAKAQKLQNKDPISSVSIPLFRGQSDSSWKLKTTLDRIEDNFSIKKYCGIIRRIKSVIESCTSKCWNLPSIEKDIIEIGEYDRIPMASYGYMAYLRHNGFPSPLLDWTRSPYIAAFFAFNEDKKTDSKIFMYMEDIGAGKTYESPHARICTMGKNVKTHKRHHLQQSEYSFCVKKIGDKCVYGSHEEVFSLADKNQDIREEYTLPYSERAVFF
ncbi:MAG: FRG domain-containing protein [Candidatus Omnitrophota bacterium]